MRPLVLFCVAVTLLQTGCAARIARVGTDTSQFTTRDQVHQALGRPDASGGAEGETYEDYCYQGKVAENMRASVLFLVSVGSLGLVDFYYVPCELLRACWMPLVGYDLHFQYDGEGKVTKHTVEGVPGMPWPLDELRKQPAADPLAADTKPN
jgi:hypothetical protein